jgi:DNA (cytosine-5)-methyltransferase 1
MSTITTQDHHHLVEVFIGTARDHRERVGAFLRSYYGSDQQALVTVAGQEHVIVDIGMRMLEPHELAAAQGFPPSYQLATVVDGKPLSKTVQIRCIGNSVCPPVAAALVRANVTW